jgi:hypothetical protein
MTNSSTQSTISETVLNERILQDRIQDLLKDWTLSDGERSQLEIIKHRIMQRHPDQDVSRTDIERIVTSLHTDTSFGSGFSHADLMDLLFNA